MPHLGVLRLIPGVERAVTLANACVDVGQRVVTEVPRLLTTVSGLVARVDALIISVEQTVATADRVIARCDETRVGADELVSAVDRVNDRASALVSAVEVPVSQSLPLLHEAARIDPAIVPQLTRLARLSELVDTALALKPLLDAAADADPESVRALDKLLAQMSDDVVPTLQTLASAVPDVQELREVVTRLEPMLVDVEHVVAGLPGAQRMRKRGEKELDDSQFAHLDAHS
jgi:hypothetical protein